MDPRGTVPPNPAVKCADAQCVVVAIAHATMRSLIVELLARDTTDWSVIAIPNPTRLPALLASHPVDLVVVDGADFPECCCDGCSALPLGKVVVIGAEPDDAYEAAALRRGAGAWLPRDRVGEELCGALRRLVSSDPGVA